ncbi:type II toxin-antitoxin system Phd/YefM family antitoxin [Mycolicibacterium sp. S3B2]|uniref:type II toxin-antitoxin system Phd/YefM family antitoxin n=1 Tax=Mycolicibacterium sp. S3B2 TaxID=3415120 RepID=UPI003C79FCA4
MAKSIPERELRNENAKVIDAVANGATFIVTRNGEPVAEIRPIQSVRKTFIRRQDLTRNAGVRDRIDPDQFRRDLDNTVDQSL